MEHDAVRRQVLTLLAHADTRFGRGYFAAETARAVGCDEGDVWEALWSLVADGLVYLDPSRQPSPDNWRWRLSAVGEDAVRGERWEPRDPDGYLRRVRRDIPDVDELVLLYLTEALQAFNARCYLATSVMLGVAAERAFVVMSRSYADSSLPGAAAMRKELDRSRSNYFALWTEFRKRIEPIRTELPDGTADSLTLDAIADLIRTTRNEVGHPTGTRIDADTARVHLTIAPVYLRKMHALAAHFAAAEHA